MDGSGAMVFGARRHDTGQTDMFVKSSSRSKAQEIKFEFLCISHNGVVVHRSTIQPSDRDQSHPFGSNRTHLLSLSPSPF